MLTPFRGFWVSKVRVQRKVRWRKSTTPLLCLWIICSNISHNVKSTFSKSTSLSGSKLNPKLQYFPNVLLHPTLSVSIFFFFLKPWMRTTAFVNLYFIELRHQTSRVHLHSGSLFHCASSTLAWVFYTVDQEETILIQCSKFKFY